MRDCKGRFIKGCQINLGRKCSEEKKAKIGRANRGRTPKNKGTHFSMAESVKNKISLALKGKKKPPRTKEHCKKISQVHKGKTTWCKGKKFPQRSGENHHFWRGGQKLRWARSRNKRREKGFVLITNNNPYNEPIEYHHVHPGLPYVVPCPKRIHQMFPGAEKSHFQNVNAMLGFKLLEEGEWQIRKTTL